MLWYDNEEQIKEATRRLSGMTRLKVSDDNLVKDIVQNALIRLWKCGLFNHETTVTEEMYTYCFRIVKSAIDEELRKHGIATPKSQTVYEREIEEWETDQRENPDKEKAKPTKYVQRRSDEDVVAIQEQQSEQLHCKLTSTELKVYAREVFPVLREVIEALVDIEYTVDPLRAMYLYLLITNTTELSMAELNRRLGREDKHPSQTFNRFCAKVEKEMAAKGHPLRIGQTTLDDFETKAEG